MKSFSLKEYLKNTSRKVVTRSGKQVKIHCTNFASRYPIIAEIDGQDKSDSFTKDGESIINGYSQNDLFFASEKHEGWANILGSNIGYYVDSAIFNSKEEAEVEGKVYCNYVATVKIEWEE